MIASRAYSEQLGWKRQQGPKKRAEHQLVAAYEPCQAAAASGELPQQAFDLRLRLRHIFSRELGAQPHYHIDRTKSCRQSAEMFSGHSFDSIAARGLRREPAGQLPSPAAHARSDWRPQMP